MSPQAYKSLPLLRRSRWSAGTLHVRSLRLKVEPEASIWRSMTVRGLGIWSARSDLPDRHGWDGPPEGPSRALWGARSARIAYLGGRPDRQLWRARGRPCPDLSEEADIVPARPVLDDDAVDNPPDLDVGPRDGRSGLGSREQWHGRSLVAAVHRHVVDHELAFSDEVVVIDSDLFTEVVDDRREDLFPTFSALFLRTCGVVHQVFGDKFVDDAVITGH